MKKVGNSILTYILVFLLVGGLGFLVTNGSRLIGEHNSVQKEAKIALEDYLSTGEDLPVGEYVSYEVRWVLGPYATETETSTTNGIEAKAGESSFYWLIVEEGDGLAIMSLKVKNADENAALEQMSDWLLSVDGYPTNGKTLKVQGKLSELKDSQLVRYFDEDLESIFGLSPSDPAVHHLVLDTTAGRDGIFLIVAAVAVAALVIVLIVKKTKKKAAAPVAEPVSYSYDPER